MPDPTTHSNVKELIALTLQEFLQEHLINTLNEDGYLVEVIEISKLQTQVRVRLHNPRAGTNNAPRYFNIKVSEML